MGQASKNLNLFYNEQNSKTSIEMDGHFTEFLQLCFRTCILKIFGYFLESC